MFKREIKSFLSIFELQLNIQTIVTLLIRIAEIQFFANNSYYSTWKGKSSCVWLLVMDAIKSLLYVRLRGSSSVYGKFCEYVRWTENYINLWTLEIYDASVANSYIWWRSLVPWAKVSRSTATKRSSFAYQPCYLSLILWSRTLLETVAYSLIDEKKIFKYNSKTFEIIVNCGCQKTDSSWVTDLLYYYIEANRFIWSPVLCSFMAPSSVLFLFVTGWSLYYWRITSFGSLMDSALLSFSACI